MRIYTLLLLLFQAASTVQVPELPAPTRESLPNTPSEFAIINDGNLLYDQGKFDDAIFLYQEVLRLNPNNVYAMHELSLAYGEKHDYQKSVDLALKGMEYRSDILPKFYAVIGNTLDTMGQPQKAVDVYKKGLVLAPNSGILYYNLGVTSTTSLKDPVQGRAVFKQGAFAEPTYPGMHYQLAVSFFRDDLKTPALLAMSRYLVLDPTSSRATSAYNLWRQLLNGNTRPPNQDGRIDIVLNPNQKKDEGNLETLDMDISMSKVVAFKTSEGKSQMQTLVQQVDSLFKMYGTRPAGDDKDKFFWTYYMPYVTEMQQKNFVEPFVYYVSQRTTIPGVREWLTSNPDRVNAFLSWSKNYSWPKQ
jgi:tetratricopeptide (TPR) repeat protein